MSESENADDTSSVAEPLFLAEDVPTDETFWSGAEADIVDAEIVDDARPSRGLRSDHDEKPAAIADRAPVTGAPKLDEWMDFISRVLIRTATDYYIDLAFRDIDEDLLSDREIDRIHLSQEERNRIAKPFAELANKMKYTRKHGRAIIATAGSIESGVQLGLWFSRVRRIAAKYRQMTGTPDTMRVPNRAPQMFVPPMPPGGGESNVSAQPNPGTGAPSANGHDRKRPDIAGPVWNIDRA